MEGELWKLREDKPAPRANRTRRVVLVGVIIFGVLLIGGGVAGALVMRAKSARNANAIAGPGQLPAKPSGLKLVDKKITFVTGTIQNIDVRLPCSGLLTIQLTFPEGTPLNVFLVSPEERVKMDARQTFKHVDGFDARTASGNYRQAARLPAGRYCLVLLDEGGSRSVVDVNAHLSELK